MESKSYFRVEIVRVLNTLNLKNKSYLQESARSAKLFWIYHSFFLMNSQGIGARCFAKLLKSFKELFFVSLRRCLNPVKREKYLISFFCNKSYKSYRGFSKTIFALKLWHWDSRFKYNKRYERSKKVYDNFVFDFFKW